MGKKLFKQQQTVHVVALIDTATGEHFVTKHVVKSCGTKNLILHPNIRFTINDGTFTDANGKTVFICGKRADAFYRGRMASQQYINEHGLQAEPKVTAI